MEVAISFNKIALLSAVYAKLLSKLTTDGHMDTQANSSVHAPWSSGLRETVGTNINRNCHVPKAATGTSDWRATEGMNGPVHSL